MGNTSKTDQAPPPSQPSAAAAATPDSASEDERGDDYDQVEMNEVEDNSPQTPAPPPLPSDDYVQVSATIRPPPLPSLSHY